MEKPKHFVVFDVEVFRNFFLAAFKSVNTGKVMTFTGYPDAWFDRTKMLGIFKSYTTVGFNSRSYDLIIAFMAAMQDCTTEHLKRVSDAIIVGGLKPWAAQREFGINLPKTLDHIDLIEVAPGKASLKIYGGRLHGKRMQDLPVDPDADLTPEEIENVIRYNVNDLDTTELLLKKLMPQIELREELSAEYAEDLRSKSDAQIAEAVIKKQVGKMSGKTPERPNIRPGTKYRYRLPTFITYEGEELRSMLRQVEEAIFEIWDSGKVAMPPFLEKAAIRIGESVYRMGIGGLHSSEKCSAHVAGDDTILVDRDVTSYYPAIILNLGLAPRHLGDDFLKVYRGIVERRIAAKRAGNKVVAESLKITVNGSFGKFGSKWSCLYAPDLMTQVTLTGQLSLLMLIERLERAEVPVVSGNTDGIVIKCPRARQSVMDEVVAKWEQDTGFETEATEYSAIYSRDVNNYIAIKKDGKGSKVKGTYAPPSLMKNPQNEICVDAAIKCITDGVPVAESIDACKDVRQFVTVRTVKGGAMYGDRYLGKAIRWVYGQGLSEPIRYKLNGNKVPRSEGALPLMELPDDLPRGINKWWYQCEAVDMLREIGFSGSTGTALDLL